MTKPIPDTDPLKREPSGATSQAPHTGGGPSGKPGGKPGIDVPAKPGQPTPYPTHPDHPGGPPEPVDPGRTPSL
jgi:hypothetical protein